LDIIKEKNTLKTLNLFYEEPDPDRWFKYDHYARKIIRRVVRGKPVPGGQFMVYHNLVKGLTKLGVPYRLNDYKYIDKHPDEIACIIGKDPVLFEKKWKSPIVFGSSFGINPVTNPEILKEFPIKKLIVPGPWLKEMFAPYGSENVEIWPVGIDTELWHQVDRSKRYDFLIYNKIRWDHQRMNEELVEPLKQLLKIHHLTFTEITYGHYKPSELKAKLAECHYAIFLCEHETQGIAYQQILSSGIPVLAWDRGGYWQDPYWFPNRIKFQPVSSVPYWDDYCGVKFSSISNFEHSLTKFLDLAGSGFFKPRDYILQNLTLEKCAAAYVKIISSIQT